MARKTKEPKHHTFRLYFMPAVLASVRSPLWVRGVSDVCLGGLPSSPSRRHKRPPNHTLYCTKKGTKPMSRPPHYKPTTAPRPGTGISCAESTAPARGGLLLRPPASQGSNRVFHAHFLPAIVRIWKCAPTRSLGIHAAYQPRRPRHPYLELKVLTSST